MLSPQNVEVFTLCKTAKRNTPFDVETNSILKSKLKKDEKMKRKNKTRKNH